MGSQKALFGLWGNSPSELFAVGEEGTILHYDGSAWQVMSTSSTAKLNAVWGNGSQDVYAVGEQGTILHFDGITWNRVSIAPTLAQATFMDVQGSGPDQVFVVGYTFEGITTQKNVMLRFDGSTWSDESLADIGTEMDLIALWVKNERELVISNSFGKIFFRREQVWRSLTSPCTRTISDLWGMESYLFAVGPECDTIYSYQNLEGAPELIRDPGQWNTLWGAGDTLYAAGDQGAMLMVTRGQAGLSSSTMSSGTTVRLQALWGIATEDVYAVGEKGIILHHYHQSTLP